MANEEQRRAFASYMGKADTSAGQQTAQYPGAYANPTGNPYLYQQQFSGVPAAPTPPPAASSSIASYPSYTGGLQGIGGFQGGYQGGFPQGGLQQGGFGFQQNGIPRRPPPLGEGEGFPAEKQTQQHAGHSNLSRTYQTHAQSPRVYENQPPPPSQGYQYNNPGMRQDGHTYRDTTGRGAMVPSSRNFSGDVVETRKRVSEYHYQQHQPAPPAEAPPPTDTVPVLLCHTCSVCGQMRSAGYHRNNPVIPGKPLVLTPCRKCKKKVKSQQRSTSSYTRVRSCTAEEPCDWPSEEVRVDIDQYERRGRQRSRDTVFVHRSSSRPHIVRMSSSQTRFGLRGLQRESRIPDVVKSTRIRVSSLSPRRASRYEELYPRPNVMGPARSQEMPPPPPTNANQRDADEVWPPPDGVRAHLFRKAEMDAPRRPSSRIVELTPSPLPEGRRSTRVVYRSESVERDHRNVSRGRFDVRDQGRAAERMSSHPRPYRTVLPEEQNFRQTSDETFTSDDLYLHRHERRESPGGGILKQPLDDSGQSRRRYGMRESQQSTTVEIGGPRVHFSSGRKIEEPVPYSNPRQSYVEDVQPRDEDFELNYSRRRYAEDPEPPVEEMERVRIRRRSPSPRAHYEEEIRIDRARGLSPSPPRHAEDVRIRHVDPRPPRERMPPSPPMEDRRTVSGFRHVSREEVVDRTQSMTPHARRPVEDDMTDSDSAHSGEITEVKTWKGIDENGKPATFVEERRRTRMLEQGSERGGQADFMRPLNERVPTRMWRDV